MPSRDEEEELRRMVEDAAAHHARARKRVERLTKGLHEDNARRQALVDSFRETEDTFDRRRR